MKQWILRPISLVLFFVISTLPTLYCLSRYVHKQNAIEELRSEYFALKPKTTKLLLSQNNVQTFMQKYEHSDRFFCQNHLESMTFMAPTIEQLKVLSSFSTFSHYTSLKNRLNYLTGKENRLCLKPVSNYTSHAIDETQEQLMHAIELDTSDLSHLLATLEGEGPSQRPQLIITHFNLKKCPESYLVNFSLLKREPSIPKETP